MSVPLGSVCSFVNGGTPSKSVPCYWGGEIPWITSADINDPEVTEARSWVTKLGIANSATNPVKAGTVLLVTRTGVGKVAIAGMDLCFSQDITALLPDLSRLDSRYLVHFLSTCGPTFDQYSRGATIKGITRDVVEGLQIPLPPISEQRRIAAILDQAEALRAKRRAALAKLDTLAQSIFIEMFGAYLDGPVVDITPTRVGVPRGWHWSLLTDVARLATGHTPDREHEDYWNGDIPWISLTDIRVLDGRIATNTSQNVTPLGIRNSSSVLLPAGTVCFSRTASIGFVTVMGREMATSQDFMNWVCGPRLNPIFLMWALICSRSRLRTISTGSTHKTIYMRVVEQFRTLVPPIELQVEFEDRISVIENLKRIEQESLTSFEAAFLSLQHRAFRGEL